MQSGVDELANSVHDAPMAASLKVFSLMSLMRSARRGARFGAACAWALCLSVLAACASERPGLSSVASTSNNARSDTTPKSSLAPDSPRVRVDSRPPALLDGETIDWEMLRPRLLEISGGQILEELALEQFLRAELRMAGITIDDAALAREEQAALEALATDPARASQLLTALRNAQSLGPARWTALLWRNAALRALAKREVTISEGAIRQAYDVAHGPRRSARLIVVADISSAEKVRERMAAGEAFSEIAAQVSTDSSAARGGLLAPIARLDPSFPPAFREVLFTMKPGECSAAILLENGYAILQMRDEIPGDGANPSTTRADDQRAARRVQERVEMDRIARMLLRKAKPTIFEDALNDSWNRRPRSPSS